MAYNRIILEGRLGADPETRTFDGNDSSVTNFRIAVNRTFTSKDSDHPEADWFNCECWNKQGQVIQQYFKKGSRILLEGRLENRVVEDEATGKRITYSTVKVDRFTFVDSKSDSNSSERSEAPQGNSHVPFDDDDDDFPF